MRFGEVTRGWLVDAREASLPGQRPLLPERAVIHSLREDGPAGNSRIKHLHKAVVWIPKSQNRAELRSRSAEVPKLSATTTYELNELDGR